MLSDCREIAAASTSPFGDNGGLMKTKGGKKTNNQEDEYKHSSLCDLQSKSFTSGLNVKMLIVKR